MSPQAKFLPKKVTLFCALGQAVHQAVLKKRPKPPILDSPFWVNGFLKSLFERKRRRKLRSNFRRSWSEFIILRIPMTENGTFFGTKSALFSNQNMTTLETFFFSRKPNFFVFTTLIQLPMAGVIYFYFFDMVPQPPALNGSKKLVFGGHISSFFL
jgi:hypothetical protein